MYKLAIEITPIYLDDTININLGDYMTITTKIASEDLKKYYYEILSAITAENIEVGNMIA